MDIFGTIKRDHDKVRKILSGLVRASEEASTKKKEDFVELRAALLPHMYAEEDLFYPFAKDQPGMRETILEAEEEHAAARTLLMEIESLDPDNERWVPKLQVLQDLLLHHIQTEESEIFECVRGSISAEQAQALGQEFVSIEKLPEVGARA